ncbi:MAG: ribosomal RNA small subunit methyltransferase A [Polyangiaceae bacterium]|nr:ribosomal RNA small subunit methyltransferase A [Polyangiaceae bacterium]
MAREGLRPKKRFGQCFLADTGLAARIAELAAPGPPGTVVEIGAGLGALTRPLLERAQHVAAIERDRDLVPLLRQDFSVALGAGRLHLVEADALGVDWPALAAGRPAPHTLAGNLPYSITGALLERAVEGSAAFERCVFLVQLEVADRLVAPAGHPAYGALSVFVGAPFVARRAFIVRRGAFQPQPGVDSAVVVLERRERALTAETSTFRALVRAAFAQRRKTLRNAWGRLEHHPAAAIERSARAAGVRLDARGETLDVAAFARMAASLDAGTGGAG